METHLYKSSLNRADRIGKGSYSVVFKGYRKDDSSKTVAIKRIENDHDFFTENATKDIEALRSVTGHKNVVKLLDLHSDDEYIYIIMEYCEKGDLEDFLSNNNPPSYELKLEIMKQCSRGVAYIHGLNPPVVHRDIKCNNILLQNTPAGVVVKIGDFGLAKVFDQIDGDRNRFFMSTDAGSLAFRAPEMCTTGRKQYNASVDIYSLGLVFNVLINYDGKDKLFEPHTANEPRDIYWPYSMRQLDAHTKKTPMPELFFKPVVEEKYPQIKAIITAMTRFDFNQRTDILLIKAQLKKECQENSKRNVIAEHAEAMAFMKSQHDKHMREMNERFSTLETEYNHEVQRRKTLEEWQEIAKRNAASEEMKLISQHEKQIKEMNKRFSTLETEYNNEVQQRKTLVEWKENAKRNAATEEMQLISQHQKQIKEMNKRFSTLETEHNNEVQQRKKLEKYYDHGKSSSVRKSHEDEMKFHNEIDRGDESDGYNGKDQEDECELSRTLVVEGITNDLDIEDLELYFESQKTSGGESLQSINFEENSRMASLVFDNVLAVANILSREEHVIDGHSVTVKPYQPPNTEQDDAEQAITKILITGIKPGTSGEMVQLLFESEEKSGGGEIRSFEMDHEGGASAVLVYVHDNVAERVLAKKKVIFKGTEMTVKQLVEEVAAEEAELIWDKRTVYVTDFAAMSADALEMCYENQKKSGGGPVEAVVMMENTGAEKTAFVTFENKEDAGRVLDQGTVARRDGSVVKAAIPDQQQLALLTTNQNNNTSQTNDSSNDKLQENLMSNNSISVSGLDESVTDDMPEMLFEDEGRFGEGSIECLAIDQESRMASITFEKERASKFTQPRKTSMFVEPNQQPFLNKTSKHTQPIQAPMFVSPNPQPSLITASKQTQPIQTSRFVAPIPQSSLNTANKNTQPIQTSMFVAPNQHPSFNKAEMYTQPRQTTMFVAQTPVSSFLRNSQVLNMSGAQRNTDQELYRKIRSILNKLTPQKFQVLMQQMLDLEINTEERLSESINIIFEKAVAEPAISVVYANACKIMAGQLHVDSATHPSEKVTFKKLLLNRCQTEFEKDKKESLGMQKMQQAVDKADTEDQKNLLIEEMELAQSKAQHRSLGNIRFIGELFKLSFLTERIMHDCIMNLLTATDEESLECLCTLVSTVGKSLDHDKAKPLMDQYFVKLDKIIKIKQTSARIRFKLQDLQDLRLCRWKPRSDNNAPKTIEQIHKEAAEEKKETAILHQRLAQESRNVSQGEYPRGGQGGIKQSTDEHGWLSVGPVKTYRLDPSKVKISKTNVDESNITLGPGRSFGGGWSRSKTSGGNKASKHENRFFDAPELKECPVCSLSFPPNTAEDTLARHVDQHFTQTKDCPVCDKKFSSDTDTGIFEEHVEKHFES